MSAPLHVVAGVVRDTSDRVLVSFRLPHREQGGLWEFPGGKVQPDEVAIDALRRELLEELDLVIESAAPLIQITHAYPTRTVLLDVWEVVRWRGKPVGLEGQPFRWVEASELNKLQFPAANLPIIMAAQLPRAYLISPEPETIDHFLTELESTLARGIRLVQLRAKRYSDPRLIPLAREAVSLCEQFSAKLLLNARIDLVEAVNAHGVHLTSGQLATLSSRPLSCDHLVGASVHNALELRSATTLGVDFAVVGPVAHTTSHPHSECLGWERLCTLVDTATIPVFALGGQSLATLSHAVDAGCQGIAAIRGLWHGHEALNDHALHALLVSSIRNPLSAVPQSPQQ